ncbi:hypothetical protein ACQ4M3_07710 [Leptolyngbya sp. AN03gr2]|uniref:hypothetical protein n=1 Tax=unclassified Leptolyngbya TaxID=2650499 RepID=UPI003D31FB03
MPINLDSQVFIMPDILVMLDSLQQPSEIRIRFLKVPSQEVTQDLLDLNRYPSIQVNSHLNEHYLQITLPEINPHRNRALTEEIASQIQKEHNLKMERLVREGATWFRRDCKPVRSFVEVDLTPTQEQSEKIGTLLKILHKWGLVLQWGAENSQLTLIFSNGTQQFFDRNSDLIYFLEGMKEAAILFDIPRYYNQQLIAATSVSPHEITGFES